MADAILVTHVATTDHPVTPAHIEAATAPWRVVERICISPPQREGHDAFDESYPWAEAAAIQAEQYRRVGDAMREWPDAQVVYMGFVPIPLAFHLGRLFGPLSNVSVFQHHHENRDWKWPSEFETPNLIAPLERPPANRGAERDVLIRVEGSYPIASEDVRWISGDNMPELRLSLTNPHPDGLRSLADLGVLGRSFKDVLDALRRDFNGSQCRHLAASVTVGAALKMGMQINPTIHLPIQTWKYLGHRRRRYAKALLLGEFVDVPRVLLLAASPTNQNAIAAAAEVEEVGDFLGQHTQRLQVVRHPAARMASLTTLLEMIDPSVLHIACHGDIEWGRATTSLFLTTADGWSCNIETEDLLRLLGRCPRLCCVVLMACCSATLAKQITERLPSAIGWTDEIDDGSTRAFARGFWTSLVAGHSVDDAYRDGRLELSDVRHRVVLEVREGVDVSTLIPIPSF